MYWPRQIVRFFLKVMEAANVSRYTLWVLKKQRPEIRGVRVILIRDGQVLLVRHWYAPPVWTLPGGGVNAGEDAKDAATREVLEETGLKLRSIKMTIGTYINTFAHDTVRVYYADDFEGSLTEGLDAEIMTRRWFALDALPGELAPGHERRILAWQNGVQNESGAW